MPNVSAPAPNLSDALFSNLVINDAASPAPDARSVFDRPPVPSGLLEINGRLVGGLEGGRKRTVWTIKLLVRGVKYGSRMKLVVATRSLTKATAS